MTKQNTALKNLKRNLYRMALNYQSGTTFVVDKGVHAYVSLWHFFADPTDQAAVEYVVNELQHEIEKLQQKEISRESWPKFLQDEHWKEKTYQRFGVPYPGKVHETAEDTPQSTIIEQRTDATGWSSVKDVIPRVVNDIGKREI
jgi:hypothetical protein